MALFYGGDISTKILFHVSVTIVSLQYFISFIILLRYDAKGKRRPGYQYCCSW